MITVFSDDTDGFWWVHLFNREELRNHVHRREIVRHNRIAYNWSPYWE